MSEFDQQDLVEDDVGDIRFGDDFGIGVIIPSTYGHPAAGYADDSMGVEASDNSVLRLAAMSLAHFLRKKGVPQYSAKEVWTFAQSWNAAGQSPLPLDGKYTGEVQGALDAALRSLAPNVGVSAIPAVL